MTTMGRRGRRRIGVLLAVSVLSGAVGAQRNTADADVIVVVPGCAVPPSDVIGWWPLDGDLHAEIGPNLAGTFVFEPALIGDGARFSGVNTAATADLPAVSSGVSVDMWIRPASTGLAQVLASRSATPGRG